MNRILRLSIIQSEEVFNESPTDPGGFGVRTAPRGGRGGNEVPTFVLDVENSQENQDSVSETSDDISSTPPVEDDTLSSEDVIDLFSDIVKTSASALEDYHGTNSVSSRNRDEGSEYVTDKRIGRIPSKQNVVATTTDVEPLIAVTDSGPDKESELINSSDLPIIDNFRDIVTSSHHTSISSSDLLMNPDFVDPLPSGDDSNIQSNPPKTDVENKATSEANSDDRNQSITSDVSSDTPQIDSKVESTVDEDFKNSLNNRTRQIISVSVSSSVKQVPVAIPIVKKRGRVAHGKDIFTTFIDVFSENSDDSVSLLSSPPSAPESASLVTEVQPPATSVQRSEFSVEETQPSSSEVTVQESISSIPSQKTQNMATFSSTVHVEDPQTSPVSYQTSISSATSGSRVQFYSEPPSFHKAQSSSVAESVQQMVVTSQDQVTSFRPNYERRTSSFSNNLSNSQNLGSQFVPSSGPLGSPSLSQQRSSSGYSSETDGLNGYQPSTGVTRLEEQRVEERSDGVRSQKSFQVEQGPIHQEPVEKNYEQPEQSFGTPEISYRPPENRYGNRERIYGMPEQNYEVDESVSVMSNGRIHGVQTPPSVTPQTQSQGSSQIDSALSVLDTQQAQDPNHKFGYVVEGRNFRKYRVEERTPDGFIVGEYGVVSHDDGSLRGVRYTADGTINPRLIYDALVKFLSL
ncbi:unnamed protein product [Timema podura]|uniref:Uncharacterized protein n=1 Tax=Timema podura TaxID=61482 RepID=A0ABN7NXT0_TIMPD|nr:unnamed protein product [Timema podura]